MSLVVLNGTTVRLARFLRHYLAQSPLGDPHPCPVQRLWSARPAGSPSRDRPLPSELLRPSNALLVDMRSPSIPLVDFEPACRRLPARHSFSESCKLPWSVSTMIELHSLLSAMFRTLPTSIPLISTPARPRDPYCSRQKPPLQRSWWPHSLDADGATRLRHQVATKAGSSWKCDTWTRRDLRREWTR